MIGNNTGRKAGYKPLDNRIERIYEAERTAALRRDKLAAEEKEKLAAVKREYESQRAAAEAKAEQAVLHSAQAARQAAAAEAEEAKRRAGREAEAYIQAARERLPLAAEYIIREIFGT